MIKFPKMHIALDTVNRIMNVAQDIQKMRATMPAITPTSAPDIPDPAPAGAVVDQSMVQPTAEVSDPTGMAQAAVIDNVL